MSRIQKIVSAKIVSYTIFLQGLEDLPYIKVTFKDLNSNQIYGLNIWQLNRGSDRFLQYLKIGTIIRNLKIFQDERRTQFDYHISGSSHFIVNNQKHYFKTYMWHIWDPHKYNIYNLNF